MLKKLGERARAALAPDAREGEPAAAAVQPSGPVAVYARILDGDSLWLAVTGTAETVALRHEQTGRLVEPANDAPSDPAAASYRWHLPTALPDLAEDADHDTHLVVTTGSGTPVRAEAVTDADPMRTPPTRDGRWQLDVRRRRDGALAVRRDRRGPAAELVAVDPTDGGVQLTVSDPGTAPDRLLVVDDADAVVGEVPLSTGEAGLTALLTASDVPGDVGPHWFLAVAGADGPHVAVVRPRNDSARPGHATVLPFLWSEDAQGQRSMVRLQYQHESRVRVNRLGDGEPS